MTYTCDVEIDLDLLVSGGSSDSPVPLGALVRLHATASLLWLLLPGELPSTRCEA